MKQAIRVFVKLIGMIVFFPLFLFANPFTAYLGRRVKGLFLSLYYSVFLGKKPYSVHTNHIVCFKGKKRMKLIGVATFGRGNLIQCITNYSGESYFPKLTIGDGFAVSDYCHIGCSNEITIGKNVLIGSRVLIEDHNHGDRKGWVSDVPKKDLPIVSKAPIYIGDNVWICDGAVVLAGAHIGNNCVVGAGAVVNTVVPDNSVAVGNPLRILPIKNNPKGIDKE